MKPNDDVLFEDSNDASFDDGVNSLNNSGYVEAIYTSSGVIVLRATNDASKDVDTKELISLMK